MRRKYVVMCVALGAFMGLLIPNMMLAAPGDLIATVSVPVPSPEGIGIGVAVNCEDPATIFYTNTYTPVLYKMDAAGTDLGSVPLADAAGNRISFGAICWDEGRQLIWGGTDNSGNPLSVYLIDPVTGLCTYVFTMQAAGCCGFCDGIGLDSDETIWVSDDIACDIEHWTTAGVYLGTITPLDADGNPLCSISGVSVGLGDRLYLGRNGYAEIVAVTKTGAYISHFATATGRDEDLECDLVSFAPLEVLWSKDAYGDFMEAFEVEEGTCVCAGAIRVHVDIKPTSCPNPFNMTAKGKLPVAILGTEDFDVMTVDPATIELEGVPIFTKNNGSLQYSYDDVATPFPGELCDCWGMGPDGYMDMVMHFDRQAIAAALGTVFDRQDVVLTLTGATYDGTAIEGADCVVILRGLPSDIACDEPGECGTYVPCNEPSSCLDPICATTADGEGVCVEGATSCGGLLDCPCPPGYVCIVNSCCGRPVCIPPEAFCYEDGGASKAIVRLDEVDGPTMGGRSTILEGLEMSNYPNPFNPRTEISFILPAATHVTLDIYNIVGQKVVTLVNEYCEAGERSVTWDSKDMFDQKLSSGVYFYRLQAGNFTLTKKMVLMK